MKSPSDTGDKERQLRDCFEEHADKELLRQYFEDKGSVDIHQEEEPELECVAVGV